MVSFTSSSVYLSSTHCFVIAPIIVVDDIQHFFQTKSGFFIPFQVLLWFIFKIWFIKIFKIWEIKKFFLRSFLRVFWIQLFLWRKRANSWWYFFPFFLSFFFWLFLFYFFDRELENRFLIVLWRNLAILCLL